MEIYVLCPKKGTVSRCYVSILLRMTKAQSCLSTIRSNGCEIVEIIYSFGWVV